MTILGPQLPVGGVKVGRYEPDEDGNPVLVTATVIGIDQFPASTRYFLEGYGPRGRWWKPVTVSKYDPEGIDPNPWKVLT